MCSTLGLCCILRRTQLCLEAGFVLLQLNDAGSVDLPGVISALLQSSSLPLVCILPCSPQLVIDLLQLGLEVILLSLQAHGLLVEREVFSAADVPVPGVDITSSLKLHALRLFGHGVRSQPAPPTSHAILAAIRDPAD